MASRNVHPAEDRKSLAESPNTVKTVWLSSEQMALLFERDRTVIQRHIRNIYSEGELIRDTTSAKIAHMGKDEDQ